MNSKIKWLVGLVVSIAALVVVPASLAGGPGSTCVFGSCNPTINSNNTQTTTVTKVPVAAQIAAQSASNTASTSQSNSSDGNSASSSGGSGGSGGAGGSGGSIDQSSNASAPTCNVLALCGSSADSGSATSNGNTSGNANASCQRRRSRLRGEVGRRKLRRQQDRGQRQPAEQRLQRHESLHGRRERRRPSM